MVVGRALGGQNGMLLAAWPRCGDQFRRLFLLRQDRPQTYRAQAVTREQLPRVYHVFERMTQKIGLPMPKIYVDPNRFAECFCYRPQSEARFGCGVTEGILNLLNDEELEGVLAHELGHVEQSRHSDQLGLRLRLPARSPGCAMARTSGASAAADDRREGGMGGPSDADSRPDCRGC